MDAVRITCPKCNFSREMPADKMPDRPIKLTCPKCKTGFSFSKGESGVGGHEISAQGAAAGPSAAASAKARPRQVAPSRATAVRPAQQASGKAAPALQSKKDRKAGIRSALIVISVISFLMLAAGGVYYLRAYIPFLKPSGSSASARQVITIPPPSGPLPSSLPPGSFSVQISPGSAPADSGSSQNMADSASSGKKFEPSDFSIFIYAVNAPGRIMVNGLDYKEIKDEPDMQYNINGSADPFHYGSNTVEFEINPSRSGERSHPPELRFRVSRKIAGESRKIGEWSLSDRDGWPRSITIEIPESPAP